jgi:hypothetical protein
MGSGTGNRKHVPSLTKNDPKNISSTTNDLNFSLSYQPRTQYISLIKIINQKQFPEQECKHFWMFLGDYCAETSSK